MVSKAKDRRQSLLRKLDKIRREQQFFRSIELSERDETEAKIDLKDHRLTMTFDPEWLSKINDQQLRRYLQKKNIPEESALETLLRDLLHHEIEHRGSAAESGCPGDYKTLSEKFLDPIYSATKIEDKKKLMYLANLVMDLINNTSLKIDPNGGVTTLSGFYMFFKEQGVLEEKAFGKNFSKLYEGHCRLNLYFNGDQVDKALLDQYFGYDKDVNTAIKNFLQRTGLGAMKTEIYQGAKTILARDREKQKAYLRDMMNWENISTIFAEEFGKLMDDNKQEKPFGSSSSYEKNTGDGSDDEESDGFSSGQGSSDSDEPNDGTGSDGEGEESSSGQGSSDEESNEENEEKEDDGGGNEEDNGSFSQYLKDLQNLFNPQDGFGGELNQRENQKKLMRGNKAGNSPGWLTNFEHLVSLYGLLASDKLFDLKTPPVKAKRYPLIDLGEKRFDPEDDSLSDIMGMGFDDETLEMELVSPRLRFEIDAKVKESRNDHPDLVFAMLDTSRSMLEPMPKGKKLGEIVDPKGLAQWQYNSKYHVALIAYFMMAERFDDLNIHDADVHFANFSSSTILTRGLKNSRYQALHPQFGGTSIDLQMIERVLSKKDQLVVTISDGEIDNTNNILERFKEISRYNPCFHVQIGGHSDFSKRLLKSGIQVKLVESEKDLYDFVIDLMDNTYGEK